MIRTQLQQSPITWNPQHVHSHQDEKAPFGEIPLDAQGNVLADYLTAKGHQQTSEWPAQLLPGEPWRVSIRGVSVGGEVLQTIREYIFRERVKLKWAQIFHISSDLASEVMWDFFFRRWKQHTRDSRIWWTKFASRTHPIGRNLVRRRHSNVGKCPCCGEDEGPDHLVQCSHARIKEQFVTFRRDILSNFRAILDPVLLLGVVHLVEGFRRGLLVYTDKWTSDMHNLFVQQFCLGQGPFFSGLWLRQWDTIQQAYLAGNNRKQQPSTGLVMIITSVQRFIRALWDIRNDILHKS